MTKSKKAKKKARKKVLARSFWVAECNTMAGSGRKAEKACQIVRNTLREYVEAAIVGVVEASNLLGTHPDAWTPYDDSRDLRLIQHGPLDKAGVAAIIDTDRVEVVSAHWVKGVEPYIDGRRIGMRTRWMLILRVRIDGHRKIRRIRVLHLPPKRFWALWAPMIHRIGPRSIDLGDFNKLARAVAPATGKRAVMDRLTGILVPRSWRVLGRRVADVKADHNAVGAHVAPPKAAVQ